MNDEQIARIRKLLREALLIGILLIIFLLIYRHDTQVYKDNLKACEEMLMDKESLKMNISDFRILTNMPQVRVATAFLKTNE